MEIPVLPDFKKSEKTIKKRNGIMKTIVIKSRIFALAAVLAGIMTFTSCEEHRINESRLPEAAQAFIAQYFVGETVVYAEKERDDRRVTYNVLLSDGTDLDFNENGEWTSVDCNLSPVPDGIVPQGIIAYLALSGQGDTRVFKIEKVMGGYEITVVSGRELLFDADGNFVREER